jgi:hypothetical protein
MAISRAEVGVERGRAEVGAVEASTLAIAHDDRAEEGRVQRESEADCGGVGRHHERRNVHS